MTAVENIIKVKKPEHWWINFFAQWHYSGWDVWLKPMGKQTEVMTFPCLASKRLQPLRLAIRQPKVCNAFWVENEISRDDVLNNSPVTPPSPGAYTGFLYGGGRHMFWHSLSPCSTPPLSFPPSPSLQGRNECLSKNSRAKRAKKFLTHPHIISTWIHQTLQIGMLRHTQYKLYCGAAYAAYATPQYNLY